MLVRVQSSTGSATEKALLDWLQNWVDPASPRGIAILNGTVFHSDHLHKLDAIIWTPTGCVIIEVEELLDAHTGVLRIPLNGTWTLDDQEAKFAGNKTGTPLDKSRDQTFALQGWLAEHGLGQRAVQGVVVLIPPADSKIEIEQGWSDPSFDVILGDDEQRLRHYFRVLAAEGQYGWTANDVALTFRRLGILPYLPPPQDLLAEGFLGPIDVTLWHGGPAQAEAEQYAEQMAAEDQASGIQPFRNPWYSPWRLYPRERGDVNFGRGVMRLVFTVGCFVAVAWVIWFGLAAVATYLF